jgi:hypothetical protein
MIELPYWIGMILGVFAIFAIAGVLAFALTKLIEIRKETRREQAASDGGYDDLVINDDEGHHIDCTPTQREQEDALLALGESELGELILGDQDWKAIQQIKQEREEQSLTLLSWEDMNIGGLDLDQLRRIHREIAQNRKRLDQFIQEGK